MPRIEIQFNETFNLQFDCVKSTIIDAWLERLDDAITNYKIDDPKRFYGFSDETNALATINSTIRTINNYFEPQIDLLSSIYDYDRLNYLHHIFETKHGLLDKQTDEFRSYPLEYQKALAQLNIDVHRCESFVRGNRPRFVVTYFDQPKVNKLSVEDYSYMTNILEFGTIYLNYVEIGKTLEDLAQDNDQYISDDAFKPLVNYSSDFNVKFWDSDLTKVKQINTMMDTYYEEHKDFFLSGGYERNHPHLKAGSIPLAKLNSTLSREEILQQLKNNQCVTRIKIK